MKKILLINGPNLNLLGTRETDIYGKENLVEIVQKVKQKMEEKSVDVLDFQSNSEGEIIHFLHTNKADYAIINPAALSHTSVALYDAFLAVNIPFVEVHISNIYKRESFRRHSYLSSIAQGVITGLGVKGYLLAADFILEQL